MKSVKKSVQAALNASKMKKPTERAPMSCPPAKASYKK